MLNDGCPDGGVTDESNKSQNALRRIAWKWCGLVLLLVITFFAGRILGWGLRRYYVAQRQREVVTAVRSLEGIVYYDDQLRCHGSQESLLSEDEVAGWHGWKRGFVRDALHDVIYITFAQFKGIDNRLVPLERAETTDVMLEDMCELRELRWLALNGTHITDSGLEAAVNLPHLERLWLSHTRVGDIAMEKVARMHGLQQLFLDGTEVTDAGLANLASLPRLRLLSLINVRISDAGLRHVRALPELQSLMLDGTHVNDDGLRQLSELRNLQTLSLNGTRIGDAGLAHLRELSQLKDLRLDGTRISSVGLQYLKNQHNLEVLSLNGSQIDNSGLEALRGATRLRQLSVMGTNCTFSGVVNLFTQLQGRSLDEALDATVPVRRNESGAVISLDLASLRTTDAAASLLKQLDQLEWLFLQGSEVSDEILKQIAALPRLSLLNLNNTSITDAGVAHFARSPHLQTLHLANTQVTEAAVDRLKQSLGGRLRVYSVDFSRNGLSAVPGAMRAAVPK